jgi:hypothetical protein
MEQKVMVEAKLDVFSNTYFQAGFLRPWPALQRYLEAAERDGITHSGEYERGLVVFLDANEMQPYKKRKCHLLSVFLANAKQPHQVDLQVCLGRWLGKDSAWAFKDVFHTIHLEDCLLLAKQRGLCGRPLRILFVPDWGCLGAVLGTGHPGGRFACVACVTPREVWKICGFVLMREREFNEFDTPLKKFLSLFAAKEDLIYDPLHCLHPPSP